MRIVRGMLKQIMITSLLGMRALGIYYALSTKLGCDIPLIMETSLQG